MLRVILSAASAGVLAAAAARLRIARPAGAAAGAAVACALMVGCGVPGLAMLLAFYPLTAYAAQVFAAFRRRQGGLPPLRDLLHPAKMPGLPRGAKQVLANGGVAAALAVWAAISDWPAVVAAGLTHQGWSEFLRPLGAGSPALPTLAAALASAAADTASHEIGEALGGTTLLPPRFIRVRPGATGGVSLAGCLVLAAVIGAFTLLAATVGLATGSREAAAVAVGAFGGNLADTLVGALVEARWRCWGNNLTNLASTAFAAAVAGGIVLA